MQLHVTYTIGLGRDCEGKSISPTNQALFRSRLHTYAYDHIHGGTITFGNGFWRDGDERLITEPVMIIDTVGTSGITEANRHAKKLAAIAHQYCVHVALHETFGANITHEGKVV
jgi:hypothetical protein